MHGHPYLGGSDFMKLFYLASERNIDFLVLGHTHKPIIFEEDNRIFLNPISISRSRQGNLRPSYMIAELENGSIKPKIHYLEKK